DGLIDLGGLYFWLRQRQKALLKARLPIFGNDLSEVLRAAGVPTELQQSANLDDLPLLFPDLLEPAATA
ncbi:MAG: hypothetical protein ACFB21_13040, partial [Opitutales bacterium]